ncbi:hypothetical protein F511_45180 [Dorcoceras hygrometricum]|uniref:Uncharacterized protein n=1 Tax=Dorcoceras hygrometricum TaxID=472368 RepID=A0A2Z6ZWP0_9LAMI|nr:hypothetical protein F511_45180 [Dorcoceras hygrometricum]
MYTGSIDVHPLLMEGPISYTGPKTSRAARDRPKPNPRRIQPSRHRRSFAGAAASGGGANTKNVRQSRNVAPRATHGRAQRRAPSVEIVRHPASNGRLPKRDDRTGSEHKSRKPVASMAHSSAAAAQSSRNQCDRRATVRDNSREAAPSDRQPVRNVFARGRQQIHVTLVRYSSEFDRQPGAAVRARARAIARSCCAAACGGGVALVQRILIFRSEI